MFCKLRYYSIIWYGGNSSYENVEALLNNTKVKDADIIFAVMYNADDTFRDYYYLFLLRL
ncbi:hypothetical protein [Clostridium sp.]|uniref:hypothetical protein n=1 Tax=Clostridium sp. TaxID=1506 RepID=UPI00343148A8